MAYEPTIWKDRVVEKPRTFNIVNNPDGTVTLVPAPGVVVEEGTPVNAANLNKLEQGLKTHEADKVSHWHLVDKITLTTDVAQLDIDIPTEYSEFLIFGTNLKCTGAAAYPLYGKLNAIATTNAYIAVNVYNGVIQAVQSNQFELGKALLGSTSSQRGGVIYLHILNKANTPLIDYNYYNGNSNENVGNGTIASQAVQKISKINLFQGQVNIKTGSTFEIWGR